MRFSLVSTTLLATAVTALALPADSSAAQLTFSHDDVNVPAFLEDMAHKAHDGALRAEKWVKEGLIRKFDEVRVDGITYELVQHDDFPQYKIRLSEPKLCDPSVKQYSGYLDIDDEVHLFFWFFESRKDPKKDPLVMWLNGGPGCSSSTGLLFELGPCSIANEGQNTTYNPHSWTEVANMIFLDQPTQVGYSYGGRTINSSPDAAKDVYAFMQLFYQKFPQWTKTPFTVAGESYAGAYIPNIGSFIHESNKALPTPSSIVIPLETLMIGNGLTDAYTQFASIPEYACDSKFAIFDEATCDSMRSKVPTCQRLTKYCYNTPNRFTCVPATLSCWQVAGPIQQSDRNPYDVRKSCDRNGDDGPLCYKEMQWIETYLNKPEVKAELGASEERTFESCNMQINQAFTFNGDATHNWVALLPPLLEDGIRLLVYAGEADFMCNYLGNLAWTQSLEWTGKADYNLAKPVDFTYSPASSSSLRTAKSKASSKVKKGGKVRSVGAGAGTLAYMQVYDAGHMVPFDQPVVALEMVRRWLANEELSSAAASAPGSRVA